MTASGVVLWLRLLGLDATSPELPEAVRTVIVRTLLSRVQEEMTLRQIECLSCRIVEDAFRLTFPDFGNATKFRMGWNGWTASGSGYLVVRCEQPPGRRTACDFAFEQKEAERLARLYPGDVEVERLVLDWRIL